MRLLLPRAQEAARTVNQQAIATNTRRVGAEREKKMTVGQPSTTNSSIERISQGSNKHLVLQQAPTRRRMSTKTFADATMTTTREPMPTLFATPSNKLRRSSKEVCVIFFFSSSSF